jgi:hypothetical protein
MQITIARQLGLDPSTVSNFFMNARRRSIDKWREDADGSMSPGPGSPVGNTTTTTLTLSNGTTTRTVLVTTAGGGGGVSPATLVQHLGGGDLSPSALSGGQLDL